SAVFALVASTQMPVPGALPQLPAAEPVVLAEAPASKLACVVAGLVTSASERAALNETAPMPTDGVEASASVAPCASTTSDPALTVPPISAVTGASARPCAEYTPPAMIPPPPPWAIELEQLPVPVWQPQPLPPSAQEPTGEPPVAS